MQGPGRSVRGQPGLIGQTWPAGWRFATDRAGARPDRSLELHQLASAARGATPRRVGAKQDRKASRSPRGHSPTRPRGSSRSHCAGPRCAAEKTIQRAPESQGLRWIERGSARNRHPEGEHGIALKRHGAAPTSVSCCLLNPGFRDDSDWVRAGVPVTFNTRWQPWDTLCPNRPR